MLIFYWLTTLQFLFVYSTKGKPQKKNCIYTTDHLTCKEHLPNIEYPSDISTLELSNLKWKQLDFNNLVEKFPNVRNITVYKGSIAKMKPPMKDNKIENLQLKYINIGGIEENFFENFTNLKLLNLEGNLLKTLDINVSFGNISDLYLSNNKWNCSENLTWALKYSTVIRDVDKLLCHQEPYSRKPLLPIAKYLKSLINDCPQKCICTLPKVVQNLNSTHLEPMISVNCSRGGFTQLPSKIPPETMILHLENNDISNLAPLKSNPIFRSVTDLYLDNNTVRSIEELEGSFWFTHFRIFSLSGNKLTELPSYALDNALLHNTNAYAVQLSLGGNPWRCDCVFTPVFQELLQKYAPNIKDIRDVKCSYVEGDENSLLPILDLSRSSVCRYPTEYSVQEALDLLNAILASLIVFILGKLAYDYYHFKKTGRLPWIVTKIP